MTAVAVPTAVECSAFAASVVAHGQILSAPTERQNWFFCKERASIQLLHLIRHLAATPSTRGERVAQGEGKKYATAKLSICG